MRIEADAPPPNPNSPISQDSERKRLEAWSAEFAQLAQCMWGLPASLVALANIWHQRDRTLTLCEAAKVDFSERFQRLRYIEACTNLLAYALNEFSVQGCFGTTCAAEQRLLERLHTPNVREVVELGNRADLKLDEEHKLELMLSLVEALETRIRLDFMGTASEGSPANWFLVVAAFTQTSGLRDPLTLLMIPAEMRKYMLGLQSPPMHTSVFGDQGPLTGGIALDVASAVAEAAGQFAVHTLRAFAGGDVSSLKHAQEVVSRILFFFRDQAMVCRPTAHWWRFDGDVTMAAVVARLRAATVAGQLLPSSLTPASPLGDALPCCYFRSPPIRGGREYALVLPHLSFYFCRRPGLKETEEYKRAPFEFVLERHEEIANSAFVNIALRGSSELNQAETGWESCKVASQLTQLTGEVLFATMAAYLYERATGHDMRDALEMAGSSAVFTLAFELARAATGRHEHEHKGSANV